MTVTLNIWMLPVVLTLACILAAILWPVPDRRGDYDFSRQIKMLAIVVCAGFAILLVWVVFLALKLWMSA